MADIPYIGEIFSFLCSVLWAAAVIFFRKSGRFTKPFALNFFKNTVASILFILTSIVLGKALFINAPAKDFLILAASGIIGIALADTLFFQALNKMGASLTQIVNCLYMPIMIALSFLFLNETFSFMQFIGTGLIILAINISTRKSTDFQSSKKDLYIGMLLAFLSMLFMAIGVIIVKPILSEYPVLWCTEIRLISGTIGMALVAILLKDRRTIFRTFKPSKNWKYLIPGSAIGAYLAMIIWLAGIKYTQANIASAINQTNVIFVFIFASIFLKEKFTIRKLIGVILSFAGVLLVTLG
ncbi:MAG: DMT family transporter [Candidatus Cloacimonetes bacterium]|nr:DMT family transporter [Candidatus Cloacimonadota bacterium]MBS3768590.1 DMT family transporter [Candidatus Cloacimonadota bacterium]